MTVYIITRDEKDKPMEIMGVWSERVDLEIAVEEFYDKEEDPMVDFDTHEWEIK